MHTLTAKLDDNDKSTILVFQNNKAKLELTFAHIRTILDSKWLTDEIINYYLLYLGKEINPSFLEERAQAYCLTSFFYQSVHNYVEGKTSIELPMSHFQNDVLSSSLRRLLIPLNVRNSHWILLEVDFGKRKILAYDPLPSCTSTVDAFLAKVAHNICNVIEAVYWKQGKKRTVSRWPLENVECKSTQSNSIDCGVFVCKYATAIITGDDLIFETDSDTLRRWLACEILSSYKSLFVTTPCFVKCQELVKKIDKNLASNSIKKKKIDEDPELDLLSLEESSNDEKSVDSLRSFGEESDLDDILLLVPSEFPADNDSGLDDELFRIMSRKQQYINVSKQTIRVSRPPERDGFFCRKDLILALKRYEMSLKAMAKDPTKSSFYSGYDRRIKSLCHSLPDITWPLHDPVIINEIMFFLEHIAALSCASQVVNHLAKTIMWPEAMVYLIKETFNVSNFQAMNCYSNYSFDSIV